MQPSSRRLSTLPNLLCFFSSFSVHGFLDFFYDFIAKIRVADWPSREREGALNCQKKRQNLHVSITGGNTLSVKAQSLTGLARLMLSLKRNQ